MKKLSILILFILAFSVVLFSACNRGKQPETADEWYLQGDNLYNQKKYTKALESFDKAILLFPDYTEAWIGKGLVMDALGNSEQAVKYYDKALSINPEDTIAMYCKGLTLNVMEKKDEAIEIMEYALTFAEANKDSLMINLIGEELKSLKKD